MSDPLDPRFDENPLEKRKLLNFSISDDDGKELACLCVYYYEEAFSNKTVREVNYKVLGEYHATEEIILEQVRDEISKRSFKPVIFT